jgi:hypothetical protein
VTVSDVSGRVLEGRIGLIGPSQERRSHTAHRTCIFGHMADPVLGDHRAPRLGLRARTRLACAGPQGRLRVRARARHPISLSFRQMTAADHAGLEVLGTRSARGARWSEGRSGQPDGSG